MSNNPFGAPQQKLGTLMESDFVPAGVASFQQVWDQLRSRQLYLDPACASLPTVSEIPARNPDQHPRSELRMEFSVYRNGTHWIVVS